MSKKDKEILETIDNLENFSETIIDEEVKKKRGRPPKSEQTNKNYKKSQAELKEDFSLVTNTYINFRKSKKEHYIPDDFKTEVKGLLELINKFPELENIIFILNPIIGLISFIRKIIDIESQVPKNPKQKTKIYKPQNNIEEPRIMGEIVKHTVEENTTPLDLYKPNGI